MKYLSLSLILVFAISIFSEKSDRHDLGSEYQAKYHSSLVLFHYKKDVMKVILTKDLIFSFDDLLRFSSVDSRDLYKIKKGEKIRLIESFKGGGIFKVKLLKEGTNRPYYYVESASLKNYILEEPNRPLVN